MLARTTLRLLSPLNLRLSASFVPSLSSKHYSSYTILPSHKAIFLRRDPLILTTRFFSKGSSSSLPPELTTFATKFKSIKQTLPGPLQELDKKLFFREIQTNVQGMALQKANILLEILAVKTHPLSNDFIKTILKWSVPELTSFYEIYSKFNSHFVGVISFASFIDQTLKAEEPKLFFNLINTLSEMNSEFYVAWMLLNKLTENENMLNKVQKCSNLQTVTKLLFIMDDKHHQQIIANESLAKKILEIIEEDYKEKLQKNKKNFPPTEDKENINSSKPDINFQTILINHIEHAQDVKRLVDMLTYYNYKLMFKTLLILKKDNIWFEFIEQYQRDADIRENLKNLAIHHPSLILPAFNLVKRLPALKNDIFNCFCNYPELAKNIFYICKTIISGTDLTITSEEFELIKQTAKKVGAPDSHALAVVTDAGPFKMTGAIKAGFFKLTRVMPQNIDSENNEEKERFTI